MENEKKPGTPLGACYFIFSLQVLWIWAIYQGIFQSDTYLLYGLTSLVAMVVYIRGGEMMLHRNEEYMGNLFILFGAIFGGFYGLSYIAYFFAGINGWELENAFLAVPLILSGIVILPSLLEFRYGGWFEFIIWILIDLWLFTSGIELLTGGYALYLINKYLALVCGLGLAYFTISELGRELGKNPLPMGKPLFKM